MTLISVQILFNKHSNCFYRFCSL